MESHKIMVDGEGLRTLAVTCRRNGTQDAWIDVALTWINAAEPEIARLRADLTAARDAAFAEGIARGKAEAERNEQSAAADAPITEQEVERLARVLIRAADAADANYLDSAQVPKLFRENAALLRRLWAERDALRRVVAAADAMRRYDSYRMPGEPHWQYDVARAAIKEGKP